MAHNTYTNPSPKPFHPWAQTLSDTHPHTPFTHGPYTDTHPYPLSPMAHNTYTHPSPKPFHPWVQTLSNTHPRPPLPMAQTQTPTPIPFHPWPLTLVDTHPSTLSPMAPILTDTHPLNPFNPGPNHSQTWNPQLCAGALGRSRGKGGIKDGVGVRGWVVAPDLGCGPRVSMEARGKCRDLG